MGSQAESLDDPSAAPHHHHPEDDIDYKHEEMDMDAEHEVDDLTDSKPRKKRRVVKLSDKKYECPEKDCTKSYSRAEHLYRHQLNHTPKQIYRCDYPSCDRHFVRADLCARHKERHTAKGSHLQRKDAFMNSQRGDASVSEPPSPTGRNTVSASPVETNHAFHHPPSTAEGYGQPLVHGQSYPPPVDNFTSQHAMVEPAPVHADAGSSLDPQLANGNSSNNFPAMNGSYNNTMMPPVTVPDRRFSFDASYVARPQTHDGGFNHHQTVTLNTMQPPPPLTSPPSNVGMYPQSYPSPSSTNFRSPTNYSALPSLPSFGFPGYGAQNGNRNIISPSSITSAEQHPVPNSRSNSVNDFNVIDMSNIGYSMPVFGNEYGFNRSPPLALNDDFLASLFGSAGVLAEPPPPSPPPPEPMQLPQNFNVPLPKLDHDSTQSETPGPNHESSSPPRPGGLDISLKESAITEKRRLRLIELINKGFNDSEQMPDSRSREEIMDGSISDPNHVMNLKMLKTFMTSYWVHVHQQMPILHRPTFNPETCPDLLMIAMMCLGASCLERTHDHGMTQKCAELSGFLAYHVRWEVFKDVEFKPTAKLWTFQTMLLLELFEKMYSTRSLHERAHIHHATTLVVMRRGSSLIGRSAIESPGFLNDPTRTPPGPDGSINTSGVNTPDASWNRWITAEATRRAAFAAFVIDATHATLFGHSAVMSPHDIKLPLPCDEALWAATSGAEVQRVEASLAANGFKPTSFLDGLKRTLNGQKVRTNTFGRVILMAGLLNVSWHMNQRDLQVSSLGAGNTLGNQMKWRSSLTRAFDHWRRDFDDSLSKNEHWLNLCKPSSSSNPTSSTSSSAPMSPTRAQALETGDSVFESRTCLHSLAHMAMHVDMIDCTVFAGSERALGRVVTDADRAAVTRRMRDQWAPSARARDAVFYALRFLYEVMIPEEELTSKRPHPHQPPTFAYSARDDYLLNRPWVLYFAALIVWSYGYALDGPIRPSNYTLTSRELQIFDMQRYLIRVGGVASPDDLEKLRDRNSCLGLLLLLRQCFREPRWELLHEASDLLGNCVNMLSPGHIPGSAAGAGDAAPVKP